MLKLRMAICLALTVSTLTLGVGLITEARLTTIIYRAVISFVLFGVCGFFFGYAAENLFKKREEGQKTDIVSAKETEHDQEAAKFSPFNPDNFEHISPEEEEFK